MISKQRYSAWRLVREALRAQSGWTPAWEDRDPEPRYEIVLVGGGGHGLATAYYLARNHGIRRVAVLERGWIGGGNTGRNHDHPLQLLPPAQRRAVRLLRAALRRPRARAQLQHHVLAARHDRDCPHRGRPRDHGPCRQRDADQRRGHRAGRSGGSPAPCTVAGSILRHALLGWLERMQQREPAGCVRAVRQTVRCLRGETASHLSFDGPRFREDAFVAELERYGSRHFAHFYFVDKMQALYLWREHARADELAARAGGLPEGLEGHAARHGARLSTTA